MKEIGPDDVQKSWLVVEADKVRILKKNIAIQPYKHKPKIKS